VAREAVLAAAEPSTSFTLMSSGPAALPGERAGFLRAFLVAVADATSADERAARVAQIWDTSLKPQAIASGLASPIVDFLQDRMLGNSPAGLVAMARGLLAADDRTEDLAKADVPVFVLYGENDNAWPTEVQEDMAALLGARRECIPGAAHSPAVEAPATTAHALTDFWDAAEMTAIRAPAY
jgi:pimeloyl-ACP methyl ester carboxylesterase